MFHCSEYYTWRLKIKYYLSILAEKSSFQNMFLKFLDRHQLKIGHLNDLWSTTPLNIIRLNLKAPNELTDYAWVV